MDFLKRDLAPVIDLAWTQIENEVHRVLAANLSARRMVDFDGPKGFDYSALNLGRLSEPRETQNHVHYGVRRVQALVEVRVPFELNIRELDNFARGAASLDLEPAIQAALRLSDFEDRAIYYGFADAGIRGLGDATEQPRIELGNEPGSYPDSVAKAVLQLSDSGVAGPYGLVLGSESFRKLVADVSHYPPRQRVAQIIGGPIVRSRVVKGGFVLSLRGGDYSLVVGQDVSIGYDRHNTETVGLFLTETFTFRMLTPEAAIPLDA